MGADADELMLTEAGWCEKCDPDWESTDCKKKKKSKKESCDNSICNKCKGDWDSKDCKKKKKDHKDDCESSSSTSSSSDAVDLDMDFERAADADELMLTEAGWCEKCDPDWTSTDCKKKKFR